MNKSKLKYKVMPGYVYRGDRPLSVEPFDAPLLDDPSIMRPAVMSVPAVNQSRGIVSRHDFKTLAQEPDRSSMAIGYAWTRLVEIAAAEDGGRLNTPPGKGIGIVFELAPYGKERWELKEVDGLVLDSLKRVVHNIDNHVASKKIPDRVAGLNRAIHAVILSKFISGPPHVGPVTVDVWRRVATVGLDKAA